MRKPLIDILGTMVGGMVIYINLHPLPRVWARYHLLLFAELVCVKAPTVFLFMHVLIVLLPGSSTLESLVGTNTILVLVLVESTLESATHTLSLLSTSHPPLSHFPPLFLNKCCGNERCRWIRHSLFYHHFIQAKECKCPETKHN